MSAGGSPELLAAYPDDECGCPVEEWVCCNVALTIHFESDGTMEVIADAGDWDHQFALAATTMEDARQEALAWVRALPTEDEAPRQQSGPGIVHA